MKQYLEELQTMYGVWKDFLSVIEEANPNLEEDFNQILNALPQDCIPNFFEWMIARENTDIITQNLDSIMQIIVSYKNPRKIWIDSTLNILENIGDPDIDKSISDNLMQIIKGPYTYGNTWIIFNLCERYKEIGNSRQVIEENYTEILETVLSKNEFLSKNKEIVPIIKDLISEIAKRETVRLSDITYCGSGQYSECLLIGDTVLKFGKKRILEDIPAHKRILKPELRRNIPNKCEEEIKAGKLKLDDVLALECQNRVDTNWYEELSEHEIEEKLYDIYKELKSAGIIWTDIKVENVGRLIKPNIVDYTVKDSKGEDVKTSVTLPIGELVIFDTDRIYTKENLPKFNERDLKESLYYKFEERFSKEGSER